MNKKKKTTVKKQSKKDLEIARLNGEVQRLKGLLKDKSIELLKLQYKKLNQVDTQKTYPWPYFTNPTAPVPYDYPYKQNPIWYWYNTTC